jgi:hypothetical protein
VDFETLFPVGYQPTPSMTNINSTISLTHFCLYSHGH